MTGEDSPGAVSEESALSLGPSEEQPLEGEESPKGSKGIPMAVALCGTFAMMAFPLILIAIDLSGVHPGLPGNTAGQIRSLSDQFTEWKQVHGAFSLAGFFSLGAVLMLRSLINRSGGSVLTEAGALIGAAGAVLFTATVIAEVVLIPELAAACARSAVCLSPQNSALADRLADLGWRAIPTLGVGARILMVGLALLALSGWLNESLNPWHAGLLFGGASYEFFQNTGLHAWGYFGAASGVPGLAGVLVLVAMTCIAVDQIANRKWATSASLKT